MLYFLGKKAVEFDGPSVQIERPTARWLDASAWIEHTKVHNLLSWRDRFVWLQFLFGYRDHRQRTTVLKDNRHRAGWRVGGRVSPHWNTIPAPTKLSVSAFQRFHLFTDPEGSVTGPSRPWLYSQSNTAVVSSVEQSGSIRARQFAKNVWNTRKTGDNFHKDTHFTAQGTKCAQGFQLLMNRISITSNRICRWNWLTQHKRSVLVLKFWPVQLACAQKKRCPTFAQTTDGSRFVRHSTRSETTENIQQTSTERQHSSKILTSVLFRAQGESESWSVATSNNRFFPRIQDWGPPHPATFISFTSNIFQSQFKPSSIRPQSVWVSVPHLNPGPTWATDTMGSETFFPVAQVCIHRLLLHITWLRIELPSRQVQRSASHDNTRTRGSMLRNEQTHVSPVAPRVTLTLQNFEIEILPSSFVTLGKWCKEFTMHQINDNHFTLSIRTGKNNQETALNLKTVSVFLRQHFTDVLLWIWVLGTNRCARTLCAQEESRVLCLVFTNEYHRFGRDLNQGRTSPSDTTSLSSTRSNRVCSIRHSRDSNFHFHCSQQ